jgi:hypothetical protein
MLLCCGDPPVLLQIPVNLRWIVLVCHALGSCGSKFTDASAMAHVRLAPRQSCTTLAAYCFQTNNNIFCYMKVANFGLRSLTEANLHYFKPGRLQIPIACPSVTCMKIAMNLNVSRRSGQRNAKLSSKFLLHAYTGPLTLFSLSERQNKSLILKYYLFTAYSIPKQ